MFQSLFSSTVGYSILFYLLIMAFFVYTKPHFLYDHDKQRFKEFKTGSDGTIFPIWGIAIVMGIFSYLSADLVVGRLMESRSTSLPSTGIQHSTHPGMMYSPLPTMPSQAYLPPMMGGGGGGNMEMCGMGSCFAPSNPPMMYGGGYFPPQPQRPFNVPASKVWKNL